MITNFGGYELDITLYTMVLTAKLSSLAFCYSDGAYDDKVLMPEQRERKVEKMPSMFEMISYTYCFVGCLMGPYFEFSDYIKFIEEKE